MMSAWRERLGGVGILCRGRTGDARLSAKPEALLFEFSNQQGVARDARAGAERAGSLPRLSPGPKGRPPPASGWPGARPGGPKTQRLGARWRLR